MELSHGVSWMVGMKLPYGELGWLGWERDELMEDISGNKLLDLKS